LHIAPSPHCTSQLPPEQSTLQVLPGLHANAQLPPGQSHPHDARSGHARAPPTAPTGPPVVRGDATIIAGGPIAGGATMQAVVIAHEIQNSSRTMGKLLAGRRGARSTAAVDRGPTSHRHHAGSDPTRRSVPGGAILRGSRRGVREERSANLRSASRQEWETMNHDVRLVVHARAVRVGRCSHCFTATSHFHGVARAT
jgi:hypothetical protein